MAGTMGMKINEGSEPRPINSAISSGNFCAASTATRMGTPADTASPPQLAMNIRTEVRMVISLVSRVSELLSAP